MSGTTAAGAGAQAAGSASGLIGIANLINSLAPIFLGSGTTTDKTTGTTSTAGTTGTTGTTTASSVTGAAPNIIQSMLAQMNAALTNATDPSKVQPIIDNIIQQAKIAFSPTLSSLPSAGIYNSTSLGLLAGNAAAQAAANAASTVLNFQQNQQQIASNIGGSLLQATKTQDTTQQQDQQTQEAKTAQQQQTGTKSTSSVIPGGITSALLGGVGLPFLTDQLGLTNIFGTKTPNGLIKRLTDSLGLTDPTATTGGASAFGIDPEQAINEALSGATTGGTAPAVASFQSGGAPVVSVNAADNPLLGGLNAGSGFTQAELRGPPPTSVVTPPVAAAPQIGSAANILPNEASGTIGAFGTTATGLPITDAASALGLPTGNLAGEVNPGEVTGPVGGDLSLTAGGPNTSGLSNTSSGGLFSDIGSFIGSAQTGFQGFAKDLLGNDIGGFLSTPAPGLGTIASDVGNVFDSGFGSAELGTAAADIGTGLASAGAGIGGSLLGNLVHKGNSIGSSIGSTIGGTAGSLFGPVGSFAGSFLGDIIGGLFGQQHPENSYYYMPTSVSNGRLSFGNPIAQNLKGNEFNTTLGLQQQLNSFNQLLDKTGLKVDSSAAPFFLGTANPHGNDPVKTFGSIGDAFSNFRFSSDNPDVHSLVAGKSFASPNDLVAALQGGSAPSGSTAQAPATSAPAAQPTASAAPTSTPTAAASPDISKAFGIIDPVQLMSFLGVGLPSSGGELQSSSGGTG